MSIEVEGLDYAYGDHKVLFDIGFSVPSGSRFALLGPNGAGKSTLLSILATLLRPQKGMARLAGVDIRRATAARRRLGVVFQGASLDDRLTVWENLEFHGLVYGMPKRARRSAIDRVLVLVGLEGRREDGVRSLSGGMRRRLEIGRALMHDPAILFLDEPTVGLDPQTRATINDHLRGLAGQGVTVLTTTHYIGEVEDYDRICIIDHGRILADGPPAELIARHGQTVIHATPKEAEAPRLRAAYGGTGPVLTLPMPPAEADAFLAREGAALAGFHRADPDLESVFLALTGRSLRDETGARRERGHRAW